MKVTIKEWNAVASWRWDKPQDDVCGICRVQFDGTCPTCKYPGDDCALRMIWLPGHPRPIVNLLTGYEVDGKCGHSFHMVFHANPGRAAELSLISQSIVS